MSVSSQASKFLATTKAGGGGYFRPEDMKKAGSVMAVFPISGNDPRTAWTHEIPEIRKKRESEEYYMKYAAEYVSPDPAAVHENRGKRDGAGRLKYPPRLDPFLLLQEWVREQVIRGGIPGDAPFFEWVNPNPKGESKVWTAAQVGDLLTREERKDMDSRAATMWPQKYIWCLMINCHAVGDGILKTQFKPTLAEAVNRAMSAEIKKYGDKGDPFVHPYAFQLNYDPDAKGGRMYTAASDARFPITDDILELINATEVPSIEDFDQPYAGSKARIRANFEQALLYEIPWEQIFVDDWEDDDPAEFPPRDHDEESTSSNGASTGNGAAVRVDAVPARRPTLVPASRPDTSSPSSTARTEPARVTGAEVQGARTRARAPAAKPPETLPRAGAERAVTRDELVDCDCALRQHPQWPQCPNPACGAEWTPDGDAVPAPALAWLVDKHWPGADLVTSSSPAGTAPAPAASLAEALAPNEPDPAGGEKCFACRVVLVAGQDKCGNCGAVQIGEEFDVG